MTVKQCVAIRRRLTNIAVVEVERDQGEFQFSANKFEDIDKVLRISQEMDCGGFITSGIEEGTSPPFRWVTFKDSDYGDES